MSSGAKVDWAVALEVARKVIAELELVCERVKVAGSLRRRKPAVGDIEIVALPAFRSLEPQERRVDRVGISRELADA